MTLIPPSAVLSSPPIPIPKHEPRLSSVDGGDEYESIPLYLSDKDPLDAKGYVRSSLYPFPQGKTIKWLTTDESEAELRASGYDADIAHSMIFAIRDYNYYNLRSHYAHREQARRNEARALARKKAEKLVGPQTPPSNN